MQVFDYQIHFLLSFRQAFQSFFHIQEKENNNCCSRRYGKYNSRTYYNCDNADIVAARTIRYADKHAKWGIDHIDNDTQNNRVDNLQLCTVSANTTLRTLRNSGFEMIDY